MGARSRREGCRLVGEPNTTLERERVVDHAGISIEHADIDALRIEDLLEAVPDEVVHRLHIEVLGEAPLDVVDEGQLRVALARLLEQLSVREGHAQAPGERGQELYLRLAEGMFAIEVLKRDPPDRFASSHQRHIECGQRGLARPPRVRRRPAQQPVRRNAR